MVASSLIRKCHCTPECVRSSQPVSVVAVLLIPWLSSTVATALTFSLHNFPKESCPPTVTFRDLKSRASDFPLPQE
ncbi:hypothetical protein RRG08_032694 [Elysia crispata]|uniref:Uncharacterized protein n=1 Tax=Elysia crispata TaxID=231223 RepID=A0AAE0YVZ4_9GAST|nr:hypothetical protein RRG08_032694 [Elysia crispata]